MSPHINSRRAPGSWLASGVRTSAAEESARISLFCLPFAGGGASSYRCWTRELPPTIEVQALRPPGREDRILEEPLTTIEAMVAGVTEAILPLTARRPFALFGHSLGALVALEATRDLARRGAPLPRHVILSARAAPHLPQRRIPLRDLPPGGLEQWLRRMNGTPESVLQNRELMSLMLPALRADLNIDDMFRSTAEPAINCPLTVLGGLQDMEAAPQELSEWSAYTRGPFELRVLDGNHFFPFNECRGAALAVISEILLRIVSPTPGS